jgi:hypothetical protein
MTAVTRGVSTLIGAAGAAALLWLATQMDTGETAGYSAFVGLVAAAGLVIAVSQLVGGWTKWGRPAISLDVLLLGFLPALVAGGWILLAGQPGSNWFQSHANDWAADVGVGGLVEDMFAVIPAIAFGIGLLFGLSFDTTGPRVGDKVDERGVRERELAATEPVAAERAERDEVETRFYEPDPETASAMAGSDRKVEIREGGAPLTPRPEVDEDRPPPA